jgi:hypothetical protein
MGQDSLSATLFTKNAHLDRSELGQFAVRKHVDRACRPPTERTFSCRRISRHSRSRKPHSTLPAERLSLRYNAYVLI